MKSLKNISIFIFITLLFGTPYFTSAQSSAPDLKNWFNQDPSSDRFAGVSTDLAYKNLLSGKTSTTVIVAVIDGGTDITHADLINNLWINPGEKPGNGIDDDENGYVDDINGWNFIGGKTGDVEADNTEAVRIYKKLKAKYDGKNKSAISSSDKAEYAEFIEAKNKIDSELQTGKVNLEIYQRLKNHMDKIKADAGNEKITVESLSKINSDNEEFMQVKSGVSAAMANDFTFDEIYSDVMEGYNHFYSKVNYHYNVDFDSRQIVNDNYENYSEKYYGNNSVAGPEPIHGTHVAGIIGAVRDNEIGINGIAKDVKIMVIRAVPNGDERDKDVANAIRYAADNGARIINMSFGKQFSTGKEYVDAAVKYATFKDVLIVHAAGNDASDIDKAPNFPGPFYTGSKSGEPAWIEVGAINSSGQIADFSNYGAKTVDVFAPGVSIYSTMPNNKYDFQDGTSMASPVVAGVAALIRSYYPNLTAPQVKNVITSSVIKPSYKTVYPGGKKKVKFKKLCSTGGYVNAYRAIEEAGQNGN